MEIDVYARERVFEMVAQRGRYLAPDDLLTLDPEEGELLERFVEHEWPDLAVAQGPELEWVAGLICGLINIAFDCEAAQRIREIPEDERPGVREQTVNAESWHQLRNRAAHQVLYAAPGRGRAYRRQVRPRHQIRRVRRRSVRSSPRRARAPSRLGDDDPDPHLDQLAGSAR